MQRYHQHGTSYTSSHAAAPVEEIHAEEEEEVYTEEELELLMEDEVQETGRTEGCTGLGLA